MTFAELIHLTASLVIIAAGIVVVFRFARDKINDAMSKIDDVD